MRQGLFVGICLAALAGPALAADLAVTAPAPGPYPWTGLYGGVSAGYADEQSVVMATATGTSPGLAEGLAGLSSGPIDTRNGIGFIGGGQAGYSLQLSALWVAGIEADFQGKTGSTNGSTIASDVVGGLLVDSAEAVVATTRWLGTVRARLGVLVAPSWLVYFTGGLAYGGSDATIRLTQSGAGFAGAGAGSVSTTRIGTAFGGGAEWMFAQNWSVKGEYLFYDLGSTTFSYDAASSFFPAQPHYQTVLNSVRLEGNVTRFGLNYHF